MSFINNTFTNLAQGFATDHINMSTIVAVLGMTVILGLYEYLIYRVVSHKDFYNKSFNIALTVLPVFISTIILTLQSDLIITLGTIGALAIIRFRTAVKDPVDMIYLLWSIHTGIVCGCRLFALAVVTSLVATLLLILLNYIPFGKVPFIVIINTEDDNMISSFSKLAKHVRVKSSSHSADGTNYVLEVSGAKRDSVENEIKRLGITKYSIIEYDNEDIS